jgi:5-formyltetrahydrofolate cyclo-ligase
MTSPGSVDDPRARKRELRSAARRAASALDPAQRMLRSRALQARLMELPALQQPGTVALYAPLPDEVELDPFDAWLRTRGWRLVYPRLEGDALSMHEVRGASDLRAAVVAGWRAPGPDAPLVEVHRLDVVMVPGVLFDREGRRLGRGGGHYDRFLVRLRPSTLSIGLCFAEMLVSRLPHEPHDVPVRAIVTDREQLWLA